MKRFFTFAFMLLCLFTGQTATAQVIWDGTTDTEWLGAGTQADPYQISTPQELAGLAEVVNNKTKDFAGEYICLTADIYLNAETTPDSLKLEWPRIGGINREQHGEFFTFDSTIFRGNFDGRDHIIHGVHYGQMPSDTSNIDNPFEDFMADFTGWEQGFFGYLENATVENLKLHKMNVLGGSQMGGLSPYALNSTIRNVHITESVVGSSLGEYGGGAGGLVGQLMNCVVEDCTVDARVRGTRDVGVLASFADSATVIRNCSSSGYAYASQYYVGGLVGSNVGLIERSSTSADVSRGTYKYASVVDCAGFVGGNSGTIRDCFATGDVVDTHMHGAGFCGINRGRIESCYATGDVTCVDEQAGSVYAFMGTNGLLGSYGDPDTPGEVVNCFATGTCTIVNDDDYMDYYQGFFSYSTLEGISLAANCYFDVEKNPRTDTKVDGEFDVTTAYLQSQEFVDTLNMMAALLGLTKWQYNAGGYPTLTTEKATNISDYFAGGSGTKEDPWRIETKAHLQNLAKYVNHGYHFAGDYLLQTADIVLNPPFEKWGEEMPELWEPIGKPIVGHNTIGQEHTYNYFFCGTYDGGLHEIQNMYAYSITHHTGLFGQLRQHASIRNLGVTDAYVKAAACSGILVAEGERWSDDIEIRQCWTSGSIEGLGSTYSCAIVGQMPLEGRMHIYNCYSDAEVLGATASPSGGSECSLLAGLYTLDSNTMNNAFYFGEMDTWTRNHHFHTTNYFVNRDLVTESVYDTLDYPDYARTTEYMQSVEMVNRMNAYVDVFNKAHADDPLLYWQTNANGYPTFTTSVPPHTITYESNGGTEVTAQRVYDKSIATAPAVPTKEGYRFYGWFTDAELQHVFAFDTTLVTGDITLYAKWHKELVADYSIFKNPFATAYVIRTPEQLLGFAHAIKGIEGVIEKKDFTGLTVKLGNDITLNDTVAWQEWGKSAYAVPWEPMANNMYLYDVFNGTFDGQGYAICGLYCNRDSVPNVDVLGLFAHIGPNGVVKNLTLKAAYLESLHKDRNCTMGAIACVNLGQIINCHVEGRVLARNCSVGLLAGTVYTPAATLGEFDVQGDFIDCTVRGEITNITQRLAYSDSFNGATGGLVAGYNGCGTIHNCHADVLIDAGTKPKVGGLIGNFTNEYNSAYATLDSCTVKATIRGGNYVGGVIGSGSANVYCQFLTANVDIQSSGDKAGGIIGDATYHYKMNGRPEIHNSSAYGTITSTGSYVGGIAGEAIDTIANCYADVEVRGNEYVGGLVGYAHKAVFDSHADGDVVATGNYAGGLVGYSYADIDGLRNCYATGAVTGVNNVGGLVGYATSRISNSYATGEVVGNEYVGGVVGKGSIEHAHATGNVTGKSKVGGVSGGGRHVAHAYATGTVRGVDNVGGLIGYLYENSYTQYDSLLYCTAANDVIATGNYVGGLAGYTGGGNIFYSKSTGTVTTTGNYAGGLTGHRGSINNCYSMATVQGADYVGGLTGYYASVIDSYFAGTVAHSDTAKYVNGLQGGTTSNYHSYFDSDRFPMTHTDGRSTEQMKQRGNYEGWDFENIWGMRAIYNEGYPYLQCFLPDSLQGQIEDLAIDKDSVTLLVGETLQLTATVHPSSASAEIVWSSDNPSVVSVVNGLLTATGAGTACVIAQTADRLYDDTCHVQVFMPTTGIVISEQEITMAIFSTYQLSAQVQPADANQSIVWSTNDTYFPSRLSVSQDGLVQSAGYARNFEVYATTADGKYRDTCVVHVVESLPVQSITLSHQELTLGKGQTASITATVLPEGTTLSAGNWWSTDDWYVASVSATGNTATITAIGAGTAEIIVSKDGVSDTCKVTVVDQTEPVVVPVTGITLSETKLALEVGDTYTLYATIIPENATNKNYTWASSAPHVVAVADGAITALTAGEATITVTTEDGNKQATCQITVAENDIDNPSRDDLVAGKYVILAQRSATANYFYMTSDLGTAKNKRYQAVDAKTANKNAIVVSELADTYVWEVVTSGETIRLKNGTQFSTWTSGNTANFDATGKELTVTKNSNGTFTLSFDTRYLSLNATAGNDYFAYYGNTDQVTKLLFLPYEDKPTTAVVNPSAASSSQVRKVFENGIIYIIRDGERYMIDGRKVD